MARSPKDVHPLKRRFWSLKVCFWAQVEVYWYFRCGHNSWKFAFHARDNVRCSFLLFDGDISQGDCLRVVWPAEIVVSPINSCSKMFYVQESKGLGSTGKKSTYRFLFCHTTKFPKSMMETSKSVGRNKKKPAEFRSERSFNRNIERIHENMKTLRHPWHVFWTQGVAQTCVLRMMVAYCGEMLAISTKIPWKFTKLTKLKSSKWRIKNFDFDCSIHPIPWWQQIHGCFFHDSNPRICFSLLAGGSASVPGSVMVGKPQRPTHQWNHFQTKKQGAQLTSVGNWFGFHWSISLKNSEDGNSTGIQWNEPLQFSTASAFQSSASVLVFFSPLRPRLWNQRILVARWCFSNRGIQDDDMSMCVLRATKKHGGRWIKHWRWCHDVASRWDFLGGVIGLWERGKRSILIFALDVCKSMWAAGVVNGIFTTLMTIRSLLTLLDYSPVFTLAKVLKIQRYCFTVAISEVWFENHVCFNRLTPNQAVFFSNKYISTGSIPAMKDTKLGRTHASRSCYGWDRWAMPLFCCWFRDFPPFFLMCVFFLHGSKSRQHAPTKRFMLINQLDFKMKSLSSCLVPRVWSFSRNLLCGVFWVCFGKVWPHLSTRGLEKDSKSFSLPLDMT